jgi:hypothetical protein
VIPPRRIVLADGGDDLPPPADGVVHVVLDMAWSAEPDRRPDVLALRDLVAPILDRVDLFEVAFQRLDAWAEAVDLAGRMTVDGVSWWYRRRLGTWLWLVERAHWCAVLEKLLDRVGTPAELEVGRGEPALAEIAAAVAASRGIRLVSPAAAGEPPREAEDASRLSPASLTIGERIRSLLGRRARQKRKRELDQRDALLAGRIATLREAGRRGVLVLTNPAVHQVVAGDMGERRMDPFLGTVVDRLRGTDIRPIVLALGADRRDDEVWPTMAADDVMLPAGLLQTRWADPVDDDLAAAAGSAVERELAAAPARSLEINGIDLAPAILRELRSYATRGLPGRIRTMRRAIRMIRDLGIDAIVLINEYGLTEWVAAGHAAGIPVVAVQHGIIIPQHVGYRHRRHPGLTLPTRTLVFGPYEARVLLEEGGYRPDEVDVSGAPRLDLDQSNDLWRAESSTGGHASERATIRRRLGIRPGDRMVVFSTTRETVHRRFYWPHVLARLLGGPLPGTHIVMKLHPAEIDDGSYGALLAGLARAGGFRPPPVSIVRDVDLLALLRAADAHVGLYSTVLTDAVAAGTPNLIAATQARTDLLGYVAAGVARPVRDAAELREALLDLRPPAEEARRAFLEDHFRSGDATGRIVATIEGLVDESATDEAERPTPPSDGTTSPAPAVRAATAGAAGPSAR